MINKPDRPGRPGGSLQSAGPEKCTKPSPSASNLPAQPQTVRRTRLFEQPPSSLPNSVESLDPSCCNALCHHGPETTLLPKRLRAAATPTYLKHVARNQQTCASPANFFAPAGAWLIEASTGSQSLLPLKGPCFQEVKYDSGLRAIPRGED